MSVLSMSRVPPRTKLGTHTPCLQLTKAPPSILPLRSLWRCGQNAVSPAPHPAGEAKGSDANGEVTKSPPGLFAPWQAGIPFGEGHRPWKEKHAEGDTHQLRARDGGAGAWERGQEALNQPPGSPTELEKQGPQHRRRPQALGASCSGEKSPYREPGAHTTRLLSSSTGQPSEPPIQWGWTHFYSLLLQHVPSSLEDTA